PNIDDMSHYGFIAVPGGIAFQVPNADESPERVVSFEAGAKYDDGTMSGSAFAYRNKFSNLIQLAPGLYNGLPFRDSNGDGVKQPTEFPILQAQNVGSSTIRGYEVEGAYRLTNGFSMLANYTSAKGTDTKRNTPLAGMPPGFGTMTV